MYQMGVPASVAATHGMELIQSVTERRATSPREDLGMPAEAF
jgi:hypothetical protein